MVVIAAVWPGKIRVTVEIDAGKASSSRVFNPEEIKERLAGEFGTVYKPFSSFPDFDGGALWNDCIAAVEDCELMNHIIFCNDVLQIPPVRVFLIVNGEKYRGKTLGSYEKKAIGAFWGFIFKTVFGYRSQMSVSVRSEHVKTATYFYDLTEMNKQ